MNGKRTGPKTLHTRDQELAICNYCWTRLPTGYYPSYKEVAAAFDCSHGHVANMLKKHGYQQRSNAETRESRPCKPIHQPDNPAPPCACGCGIPTQWISKIQIWQKYAPGHFHPKRLYHDPDWLRREYHDRAKSVDEIAKQFGVQRTAIITSMKKHGIERRSTGETLILRGSVSGSNNPAWKGGIAKWEYSSDWRRLCKQIKNRDKWTCQLCNEQRKRWGHRLHVHHIDEDKTNNDPHNLISLCSTCHAPIHGNETIRAKLIAIAVANTA